MMENERLTSEDIRLIVDIERKMSFLERTGNIDVAPDEFYDEILKRFREKKKEREASRFDMFQARLCELCKEYGVERGEYTVTTQNGTAKIEQKFYADVLLFDKP